MITKDVAALQLLLATITGDLETSSKGEPGLSRKLKNFSTTFLLSSKGDSTLNKAKQHEETILSTFGQNLASNFKQL